jgi:hypothetical protein
MVALAPSAQNGFQSRSAGRGLAGHRPVEAIQRPLFSCGSSLLTRKCSKVGAKGLQLAVGTSLLVERQPQSSKAVESPEIRHGRSW